MPYSDPEIDDFMRAAIARQNAPPGSPQAIINERYPNVGWREGSEMTPSMDAEGETDDEAYSGMDKVALEYFWRMLPKMTSEAGAKSWMETPGPMSQNVVDRREQSNMDVARGIMKTMSEDDLSGLTPQEYINHVIGRMHNSDFYLGAGAENYELPPGVTPEYQEDAYPTRKVSR